MQSSTDGLDNNLPDDNFIRNSLLSFQWDPREDDGDEWPVSALDMVMILLHVIYPSFPVCSQVDRGTFHVHVIFVNMLSSCFMDLSTVSGGRTRGPHRSLHSEVVFQLDVLGNFPELRRVA